MKILSEFCTRIDVWFGVEMTNLQLSSFLTLLIVGSIYLQHGSKESHLCVDVYDEVGIGGGASGIAGGLLHPYSPKVKLLWRGAECWQESLNLLNVAEGAILKLVNEGKYEKPKNGESLIVRRRGILRPVVNLKNVNIMTQNAQNCLAECRIELIDEDSARKLISNL